jgi:hypothetical protein
MLLAASSPHARKGELWESYDKYFGKDDAPVLIWQASTREMNSSVPQAFIDQAIEKDPQKAAAEYLAQFRSDLEAYVSREVVEACTDKGVLERLPQHGISYVGFVDPAGGSGQDAMTLAIAHFDHPTQTVIVDLEREWRPPFSPEFVSEEFAKTLKRYKVATIASDRFGGDWPVEQFRHFDITVDPKAKPKSDLYSDLLSLLNSKRIRLLDNPRGFNQLLSLERRVARGAKPTIDHPPAKHDDIINAVAGAAVRALSEGGYDLTTAYSLAGNHPEAEAAREYRLGLAQQIYNYSGGRCWPW